MSAVDTLSVAGQQMPVERAAAYLVESYPPFTLEHFDHGGSSPRDRATMEDLGRLTVFGAFRGWKAAVAIFEAAGQATWPTGEADWRLESRPELKEGDWLALPAVTHAWELFSSLAGCRKQGRQAATSKLLHLKWPGFFPVIDGELRAVYAQSALAMEPHVPGSRQRLHATTRAYWLAIRQDLTSETNRAAVQDLRRHIEAYQSGEGLKVDQLLGLTDLRLFDAVAWALGAKKLSART